MSQSNLPDFSSFAVDGNDFSAPDFSSEAIAPESSQVASDLPLPQRYIDKIMEFEGYAPKAKWDFKQDTNGYGTRAKFVGEQIDTTEAKRRFHDEINKAADIVDSFAPGLPTGARAALTDLTFNAGSEWQRMGLGAAIKAGDFEEAGNHLKEYINATDEKTGKTSVVPHLIKRRNTTYDWMFEPDNAEQTSSGTQSALAGAGSASPDKSQDFLISELERITGTDLSAYRKTAQPAAPDFTKPDFTNPANTKPGVPGAPDFSSFAVKPYKSAKQDDRWEFTKGLEGSLVGTNPKLFGSAMEGLGEISGSTKMVDLGSQISKYGDEVLKEYQPRVPSFTDIRTDGAGNFISDVGSYAGYQAGSGIGTSAPSLITGGLASLATANPLIGLAVGAAAPSYIQNYGDVYGSAKEDKDIAGLIESGKLTKKKVASVSAVAAVPMAMLDIAGLEAMLGQSVFKDAKKELAKRLVHGMVVGAVSEGSTEGLQEVVSQWAQEYLGSNKSAYDRFVSVVDNFFGGAIAGGGIGGAGSVVPGKETKTPKNEPNAVAQRLESQVSVPPALPPPAATAPVVLPTIGQTVPPPKTDDAPPPIPPSAAADDVALLKQQGWADSDIAEMGDEERAVEVQNALDQGVKPAPRTPDAPSAEPISDLTAQIESMRAGERKGVYLSSDNVANLQSNPEFVSRIADALNQSKGAEIVENVDGKGGILVAGSPEIAKQVKNSIKAGVDTQALLGGVTGAGTGKPADTAAVVQQKTKDGAVVRESAVSAEDVAKTEQEFASPGKTVETVTPEQAIARRDETIAADRAGTLQAETFTTAKGSTYSVQPDGTTIRNKALRNDPGHEGDQGVKPKSDKTVYLSPEDAQRLAPPDSAKWRVVDHGDGTVSLATQNKDGRWGIAPTARNVSYSATPSVGVTPLELWGKESRYGRDAYKSAHFGNEIVNVGPAQQGDGTRAAPVAIKSAEDVDRAGSVVAAEPTEKQAEAGNYQKAHIRFQGIPISIETPRGGTRRGVKDGVTQWEVPDMPAAYGYVKGSTGADGEQIDVFIGDKADSDRVFVIDQVQAGTGKFDEHKAVLGTDTAREAVDLYTRSFSDGKGNDRIGGISEMSVAEFKRWAKDGAQKAPVSNTIEDLAPDFSQQAVAEKESKIPRAERYEGEALPSDVIDTIVSQWHYVQDISRRGRPQSLAAYVIAGGGLRDDAREVRHIAGAAKERPGLVNKGGQNLDDAAYSAWESGFFASSERPTIAEFLDALQNDLASGEVVRGSDYEALDDIRIANEIMEELADYGVTTDRFRSEASLREFFGQERPRVAREAKKTEEAEPTTKRSPQRTESDQVDVPFDLPNKDEGKDFSPFTFSVQVAYAKTGEEGLRKKLAPLSGDQLKQIASAQNLPVPDDVITRGNKKLLVDAIIDAAKAKLANRAAAGGGGTVEGVASKAKAPAQKSKPLKEIPIILQIEIADGDGDVTVRMNGEEAISMVDRRIAGLNRLLGCLSR